MANEETIKAEVAKALEDLKRAESKLAQAREVEKLAEEELKRATKELEAAERGHRPVFSFTVDGISYESELSTLTGAQIKGLIPNFNPAYQLVEESTNTDPDKVITDSDSVRIDVKPAPAFYLVPPAAFGQ